MLVTLDRVSVTIDGKAILRDIDLEVADGERWAVIGRNGAGKSTLVRCMAGLQPCSSGRVLIDGRDIRSVGPRELARTVSYVPQGQGRTIPFAVEEYVTMGRFVYQGLFSTVTHEDRELAREALEITDTAHLAVRSMDTLSGGELQRVLIAGAVSQKARMMFLDEPSSHLDPPHQLSIQQALSRIHARSNTAMVTITHDVNAAFSGHSHLLAIRDGGIVYRGSVAEAKSRAEELLKEVFGIAFLTAQTADGRVRVLVPGEEA